MKTIFKRTVICVLCMLVSIITFSQEKKQYSDEIKGVNMSPPRFIGNENLSVVLDEFQSGSLNDYLVKQLQYPEQSREFQEEGTEVIKFVVTPKGEVTRFDIVNSLSPEIDEEVIRVLKTTNGLWIPGLNNGKPVEMGKEISISFKLCNGPDDIQYVTNFDKMAKIFFKRGNKQLFVNANIKRAFRNYNIATRYLPNDKCLLASRGICRFELGDETGAFQDWNRIKALGGFEGDYYLPNLSEFKGYSELINTLNEKE